MSLKPYSDFLAQDHRVAVNVNGGTLNFNVQVRHIPEGFIGFATLNGTEVYEYPQAFDTADQAAEATSKHVAGAFARVLN